LRAVRRGSLVQLIVLALIAAAITGAAAYWIPWLPKSAGDEADRIDFVFWFVTVIAVAVFSTVIAVLVYSVMKFRVKPDDLSDGPPTHGHTAIEIVWTAIPTVLVTAISIVSAIVLAQNSRAGDNALNIKVVAQQFAWQFTYPNGQSYGSLRIPMGRPTRLDITAKDVLHSFWVPQLGQKQDAVPGQHNRIVITPNRTGTFPVICTELCGLGHAIMRSQVEVMKPAAYRKWVRSGGKSAGNEDPGLAVFNGQGCNGCHTFTPAASGGQIGPNLDKLPAEAKAAGKPLKAFIHESILNPNAYIEPSYQAGVMPSFEGQIPPKDLDSLVQYLAKNAKS
jgi:cytochrome c oxidase subunit 2